MVRLKRINKGGGKMTKEQAKEIVKNIYGRQIKDEFQLAVGDDVYTKIDEAFNMAIEALEIVEEFERAEIITSGRLNGRTYAYKCGLEDGKRKALEQQPTHGTCKDCKQLDVMDCGYYCKLNHWNKISTEGNCGGMGDFYCADFERRDNNKYKTYIDCQKCSNFRNPDYSKCIKCEK